MMWLLEAVKLDGIQEILFIARDGYTLKKVFDLLKDKEKNWYKIRKHS